MLSITISLIASLYGIDSSLALKLAKIESNMNPNAISKTKDGGVFQLNSKYYKFHNPNWVFDSVTNTHLAMETLKNLKNKCIHKSHNSYIVCYNLGISGAKKIKRAMHQTYYKKTTYAWEH
jgi:soluble lytic murein transglycosylase-like protein